jgi:UDP-N-acetylmuramoylalanine--D-glutamate ligase
LTAFLLNECGILASACGNIGDTALAAVEERREGEVLVAELSSFQIASMHRFAPEIAVLLNITPDHVSWHGSFEAYAQAKYQLFDNMGAGSTAIIVAGTLGGDELAATLRDRGVRVVLANSDAGDNCAFVDAQGRITVKLDGQAHVLCKADELQIKGSHNVENALAAAAVACASGCDDARIAAALKAFGALEHRIEPCGTVDGVAFFNDSKATNTDATLKALTAFGQGEVVLLLGGRDKGTSLDELVEACAGVCTDVICYGEAGERFFDAFTDSPVARTRAATMREAFDKAVELAKSGQAVVLSPACASFDEFDSYGQRGKTFKAYVADLAARKG